MTRQGSAIMLDFVATELREARLLARALRNLGPEALREFWSELGKQRKDFLEDLSDVLVSISRNREPRRSYRDFWEKLKKARA